MRWYPWSVAQRSSASETRSSTSGMGRASSERSMDFRYRLQASHASIWSSTWVGTHRFIPGGNKGLEAKFVTIGRVMKSAGYFTSGVSANGYILWVDVTEHGFLPKQFDPTFPRDLLLYLLGAPSLLALGLWLSAAGLGLWALRKERLFWVSVGLAAAAAAVLWLVVEPYYLYPRFFIFLIPGCAYVLAAAVKRWKVLAPVPLQTLCVRHEPAGVTGEALDRHTQAWADRVNKSGGAYLTPAILNEQWMVRVSIGSIETERNHVEALWKLMRQEAERKSA